MAFATDRRTQAAVFVASGAFLVGLLWLGVVGTRAVPVAPGTALVSFATVTTLLLGVNVWLAWSALVQVYRAARGLPDEAPAPAVAYHRKPRGLRR